jgi:hypothetical protein
MLIAFLDFYFMVGSMAAIMRKAIPTSRSRTPFRGRPERYHLDPILIMKIPHNINIIGATQWAKNIDSPPFSGG